MGLLEIGVVLSIVSAVLFVVAGGVKEWRAPEVCSWCDGLRWLGPSSAVSHTICPACFKGVSHG